MNNPYRSGTADVWYSGVVDDLWVEYKFLPRDPVRGIVLPDLSPLQIKWLTERKAEGRNVAVVVGCPSGGILLRNQASWVDGIPADVFRSEVVDRKELAGSITHLTMGAQHASTLGYSGKVHLSYL